MAELKRAVEQRRDFLKAELMRYGYLQTSEGKILKQELHDLPLGELERIHITVKAQFGKELTADD